MRLRKYKEEKDPWPPIKTKSYVTLALVNQKELQTREETTATIYLRTKGHIDKIPQKIDAKKLTDIAQIFDPVSGRVPNSILIEGHAGIGKTTFVKEICVEWSEGKLLTSDKLVLLLLLRDPNVQKITNEHGLIEHFTKSTSKVEQLYSYLEDEHGVGVTLIIDGFDELSNELRSDSFFRELIEKRSLPKAKIVVTSRPSASACLHDVVDKRIEILGFEQSSKNQYVTEALQDSPSKLEKLQRHFQQYPNIDAICYIPLIMSIIVFLCMCQPDELPPTATKMYASFILHTICHYLKRAGKIPEDEIINKLEQFPPVVYIALQDLQKTAFDGLVKDTIVFTVKELPVFCWHDPTCYGLLQSTECYSAEEIGTPTQSFNFLHLGIQEYFAAKYVTRLPENEVYTLLKESFVVSDDDCEQPFIRRSNPDNKSVRLSNMWILYCGITSGQCKTLRHYLTTYGKPDPSNRILTPMLPPTISMMSQMINPLPSDPPVTPPTQPAYSRYPLTPSRGQHITSYPQPHHLPTVYHPYQQQQQQQLVQYPYHPMTNPLLSGHTRSHDPMSHSITMYTPTMTHLHSSHDQMVTPPAAAEQHFNSHMLSSGHTTNDWSSDQRISNTGTISQDILKDPVKVLYLFQCFQEAQNNVLCEVLLKSFDDGVIDISNHSLLPHQVMSLGFFLLRSHRKWEKLNLDSCNIRNHGINILHQCLCGDKTIKQEITEINLAENGLTEASAHLIADIINHLQPHTLMLFGNRITNVRDICNSTSTVKVLDMMANQLTAQSGISDMMICLEELCIKINTLGDDGAELLSEGITNTKTLRVLNISVNGIGPSGTTAIANALSNNTSLEELYMWHTCIGQDGAMALSNAISNNKKLIILSLLDEDILGDLFDEDIQRIDKEEAIILIRSLINNNTIIKLDLDIELCENDINVVTREAEKVNSKRELHKEHIVDFKFYFFGLDNLDHLDVVMLPGNSHN